MRKLLLLVFAVFASVSTLCGQSANPLAGPLSMGRASIEGVVLPRRGSYSYFDKSDLTRDETKRIAAILARVDVRKFRPPTTEPGRTIVYGAADVVWLHGPAKSEYFPLGIINSHRLVRSDDQTLVLETSQAQKLEKILMEAHGRLVREGKLRVRQPNR